MRRTIVFATAIAAALGSIGGPAVAQDPVTLRVLIHQNPPFVDFMNAFNEQFQAANPNIKVEMSVVNANELMTNTQTRLMANDVDVIDIFAFHNALQPWMKNVDPPGWQSLIDAGLLLDLTDQPFVANYDPQSIADAGTYNDRVYQVNLGRVGFSGIYYNKDLFEQQGIAVPTTWDELVAACQAFVAADIPCMTAGGKDGWPIFVGAYGLLGSAFPDQEALAQGLWEGTIKYNDPAWLDLLAKYQVYNRDMMEPGASGLAGDAAPGRFASGAVAMFPGGTWYGPAIEAANPAFDWGYIPFPGSNDPADNTFMFGKYDQGWAVAADSPNKDAALAYLTAFSDPANYQAFVTAVGPIPTQPGATLDTKIGGELAAYLENFRVGFELLWANPKGAGQYASAPQVNLFAPFGPFDDVQAAADQAQSDLQSGLDAAQ
jgi:raffinose/stachyose/melibiose transport system substrate-binding protein